MSSPIQGYFMDNFQSINPTSRQESERLSSKVDAPTWITSFSAYDILSQINDIGGSFLDVGCGTHVIGASTAAKYHRINVTGVDINEERISSALTTWKHLPNISALTAKATALPLPMNSFDFVHSRFLFEYLDSDAPTALQEMFRVCKRGGSAMVQDLDENMVNHKGMNPELLSDILFAVGKLKSYHVFDPYMGSKLESLFLQSGFVGVNVDKRLYHNCTGAATADFIERETKKLNNLLPVLHKIFDDYQKALDIKNKYLQHLANPATSTQSYLFTVNGIKPSILQEAKRINTFYRKISAQDNSNVTVRPHDFIIYLLKKEEELQRTLIATKFTPEGDISLTCYIQPLDERRSIYAFRGVASSTRDYRTFTFINHFLQQNNELTFITKVKDAKTVKSLEGLGFNVYDKSNGGFGTFKSKYGLLLDLYVQDPWNQKTEDDYNKENAIFCVREALA